MASNSPLSAELSKRAKELDASLEALLADPTPESIHEVRTLIRRMGAARRLLPRGLRRKRKVERYFDSADGLFRATTPVSDLDIAASSLRRLGSRKSGSVSAALEGIKRRRPAPLVEVLEGARDLRDHRYPPVSRGRVPRSKLSKNRRRTVAKLEERIQGLRPQISSDQKALHAFRKDCKTLRYVLEIGKASRREKERVERLKRWQDALGQITDIDATLRYISSNRLGSQLGEIERALQQLRSAKLASLSRLPEI